MEISVQSDQRTKDKTLDLSQDEQRLSLGETIVMDKTLGDGGPTLRSHHLPTADQGPLTSQEEQVDLSKSFGPSVFSEHRHKREGGGDWAMRSDPQSDLDRSRFEVREVLGSGGYGEVYGAKDLDLNRDVALKQFKGELREAISACQNELRFVGRLEHPSVPPVYQAALTTQGMPYIVMKRLRGEPLADVIDRLKRGDPETHAQYSFRARIELVVQLLRVLESAHQAEVLHRDIKPDNIYLSESGDLSLIDWGIAEDFSIARAEPILCGTPLYFSPEQGQAQALTPASDLFSVGAVAYELMCLHSSAPSTNQLQELIEMLPTHQPPAVDRVLHSSQGYAPSEFKLPIMKALSRRVEDRYETAREMRSALERSLDGRFDIGCPRTFLKGWMFKFSRWLDRELKNVLLVYFYLFIALALLVGLGVFIGYLIVI